MSLHQRIQQPMKKFHLKQIQTVNYVDNSLENAIRRSTVKNFIKKGVFVSQEADSSICSQNNVGLEGHLQHLKKSCSQLMRQIKCKEQETLRCKDESCFTLDKSKKIKQNRQELEQKINETQRKLELVNLKRQTASHCSKTYEHILQRMKKDGINLQLQKNQLESQLRNLQKSFQIKEAKNYQITELQRLSMHGLKDATQELQQQNNNRKNQLNNVKNEARKKIETQHKLKQRHRQTEQIQQLAADDIQDADLLKLKKYTTVQLFLREILKLKILRIKKYYQPYQNAFFRIKSNTCVKDSRSLKSQFFNFEESFNQKLFCVKNLQTKIAASEQQRAKLKQELLQIRMKQIQLIEQEQKKQKTEQLINKRQLHEKSLNHELILQRIQTWILFQCKKLNVQARDHKNLVELFRQIMSKQRYEQNAQTKNISGDGQNVQFLQIKMNQKQEKTNQKSQKTVENNMKNLQ